MSYERNVFQIWKDNKEKLPFFVRRSSWSGYSKFLVTKIEIKEEYYKKTGNLYGFAYGHYYNDGKKGEYQGLGCAGCYQWMMVENEK